MENLDQVALIKIILINFKIYILYLGKSTILNLLTRLYNPDSGEILIENTDLKVNLLN